MKILKDLQVICYHTHTAYAALTKPIISDSNSLWGYITDLRKFIWLFFFKTLSSCLMFLVGKKRMNPNVKVNFIIKWKCITGNLMKIVQSLKFGGQKPAPNFSR